MNTYAFDQNGRCLYFANAEIEHEGKIVVHSEETATAAEVWYDTVTQQMLFCSPFSVVVETNKISGIPQGTTVAFSGGEYTVDDGVFEFEVVMPQTVTVVLSRIGYLPKEVEVPCEAQA